MGATTFEVYSTGRDPDSAFREARDQALYDFGHAGYTGSIAEKGSFRMVKIPAGVRCTPKKFLELLHDVEDFQSLAYLRSDLQWAKNAADKRRRESLIKKEERRQASFWRKNIALKATLEHAEEIYGDKWGPCIALEVKGAQAVTIKKRNGRAGTHDRVFVFAGWASC
jgi:hypothetical protein